MRTWYFLGELKREWSKDTQPVRDVDALVACLASLGPGLDICELCGGEGRTSQIAVRRRLKTGKNFDLVTGFDLGNPRHQQEVLQYVAANHVMIVVMAPSCRSTGAPSYLNAHIHYETWKATFEEDMPHIMFCGRVALLQI